MKILIVEDDRKVRDVLRREIRARKPGAVIYEAGTLDQAKLLLPEVDGVLSNGSFPTHREGRPEPSETMSGNWAPVMLACDKAQKPFVLLSNNASLVGKLRLQGQFAYMKGLDESVAVLVLLHRIENTSPTEAAASSDPPAPERRAGERL